MDELNPGEKVRVTINPEMGLEEFTDNTQGGYPSDNPLILRGDDVKLAELTAPVINAVTKGKLIIINKEGVVGGGLNEMQRGIRNVDEDNSGTDEKVKVRNNSRVVEKLPKGVDMQIEEKKPVPEVVEEEKPEEAEDIVESSETEIKSGGIQEKKPTAQKGGRSSRGKKKRPSRSKKSKEAGGEE